MYSLNPSIDKLPISNEDLQRILTDIYIANQDIIDNLESEHQQELVNIFNKKDSRTINGFTVKAIAQKDIHFEIALYCTEIIMYETEDEWFQAYNEINNKNKSKE